MADIGKLTADILGAAAVILGIIGFVVAALVIAITIIDQWTVETK